MNEWDRSEDNTKQSTAFPSLSAMSSTKNILIKDRNKAGSPFRNSAALQFTEVNTPAHIHDPCYFEEQERQNPYRTIKREEFKVNNKGAYLINPYKVTFFKDKFPSLEKLPPIQMIYSGKLLADYCTMLNPELHTKEVVVFALHSIDNMGSQAIREIMEDQHKFLLSF